MNTPSRAQAALVAAAAVLASCTPGGAGRPAPLSRQRQPVSIRFAARVGTEPFACGRSYAGIGTTRSTITATDFRLYVHDVRLIGADGAEASVELAADSVWQWGGVALLDFEDGTGPCANGTPETRLVVEGRVAPGTYRSLSFVVGIPFPLNHADAAAAHSPLNLSRLFWSWNAGYKFWRLDLRTTGRPQGYVLHLGSTTCRPDGSASVPATVCDHPNRPQVVLGSFDPDRDTVVVDIAALFATANVDTNIAGPSGCMSGPTDPDCAPVFAALGLPFGDRPAGAQRVFRSAP